MVPSIGSIIQVGSSVNVDFTPAAVDSSPINLKFSFDNIDSHRICPYLWVGNFSLSFVIKISSTRWSYSVTRSAAPSLVSIRLVIEKPSHTTYRNNHSLFFSFYQSIDLLCQRVTQDQGSFYNKYQYLFQSSRKTNNEIHIQRVFDLFMSRFND